MVKARQSPLSVGDPNPEGARGVIIAVAMPKGGVGKTSMALSLAACIAGQGESIFLADTDYTNAALVEALKVRNSTHRSGIPSIDRYETFRSQSNLIKKVLQARRDGHHVVIDCNNAIEELMLHSMGIADVILVPSIPTGWALRGLERMIPMLESSAEVRVDMGRKPADVYSILTRWEDDNRTASDIDDFLESRRDMMHYLGRVHRSILFERSLMEGLAWWERYPANLRAQEFQKKLKRIKLRSR